jgi:hypothetical protein
MDIDDLVFEDGDHVVARGRAFSDGTGVWLDPSQVGQLSQRGGFARSRLAFRLVSASLGDMIGQEPAWRVVTGRWRDGGIQVEKVLPESNRPPSGARFRLPPCPEPEGGWQRGDANRAFDIDAELHARAGIVAMSLFHPHENASVLVVASADPAATERELRPEWGPRLCIVEAKWSRSVLDGVRQELWARSSDWTIEVTGEGIDDAGQPFAIVGLLRVVPEMAAWAASLPGDLIDVNSYVVPVALS